MQKHQTIPASTTLACCLVFLKLFTFRIDRNSCSIRMPKVRYLYYITPSLLKRKKDSPTTPADYARVSKNRRSLYIIRVNPYYLNVLFILGQSIVADNITQRKAELCVRSILPLLQF